MKTLTNAKHFIHFSIQNYKKVKVCQISENLLKINEENMTQYFSFFI